MKLFIFYIGGDAPGSVIELHDMRFIAAEKLEDCYGQLKAGWWGTKGTLHIDCWGVLEQADGYDIALRPEAFAGMERLYFVNLGGYDPAEFAELHKNVFVVAETESKAKVKALRQILNWNAHHQDNQLDVEKIVCIDALLGLHIHLTKAATVKPFSFICKYMPFKD